MAATVTSAPGVLTERLYHALRALRKQPTGRTDDSDRILASILARCVWEDGWRKRNEPS